MPPKSPPQLCPGLRWGLLQPSSLPGAGFEPQPSPGSVPPRSTAALLQDRSWPWGDACRRSRFWARHLPRQAGDFSALRQREKGGSSTDYTPYFFPIKCSAIKKQGAYPCQGAMTLTKMQQLHLLTPKPIQLPHADCIQKPYCNLIWIFTRIGQGIFNQAGVQTSQTVRTWCQGQAASLADAATEQESGIWHQGSA